MATLSDLEEMKEALDKGLVSQAEYDDVKRDYLRAKEEALEFQRKALRAKEEFQKKELRAKEEALEANKEFQKRELIAKEAFQQTKSDAELRVFALESIVKHGASIMSDDQKVDLIRDFAKMSGLDCGAEKYASASKRQRTLPAYLYLEEVSPDQNPTSKQRSNAQKWSEEEELTFIQAHREGKTFKEITAMLPGRSFGAVKGRWRDTKIGKTGSAALRAYVAECCKDE